MSSKHPEFGTKTSINTTGWDVFMVGGVNRIRKIRDPQKTTGTIADDRAALFAAGDWVSSKGYSIEQQPGGWRATHPGSPLVEFDISSPTLEGAICSAIIRERAGDLAEDNPFLAPYVNSPLLAPKHTGMRISASGVLGRIRDGRHKEHMDYVCGEMLRHLEEMSVRFYKGDIKVVDEFLQLYALDDTRPDGQSPTTPQEQVDNPKQKREPSADYSVSIELSITAESHIEAARYALDDLRDTQLGPLCFKVENNGDGTVQEITIGGDPHVLEVKG